MAKHGVHTKVRRKFSISYVSIWTRLKRAVFYFNKFMKIENDLYWQKKKQRGGYEFDIDICVDINFRLKTNLTQ